MSEHTDQHSGRDSEHEEQQSGQQAREQYGAGTDGEEYAATGDQDTAANEDDDSE